MQRVQMAYSNVWLLCKWCQPLETPSWVTQLHLTSTHAPAKPPSVPMSMAQQLRVKQGFISSKRLWQCLQCIGGKQDKCCAGSMRGLGDTDLSSLQQA